MVERGTGPRSLMELSKGGQEPSGGLAVYVSQTELSMSSSVCELSVESRSLFPPSGEPCPPFYRPRGEQGLQMGERGKYQGYRRSFEGSRSPFFPVPALHNMADRVRSGVVVDLRRPCPGLI